MRRSDQPQASDTENQQRKKRQTVPPVTQCKHDGKRDTGQPPKKTPNKYYGKKHRPTKNQLFIYRRNHEAGSQIPLVGE